jgi:hypothetical protein
MPILTIKEHLSRKQAAAYLCSLGFNIAPKTLANLAYRSNRGDGPPYTRFRSKTVYARGELEAWARRHAQRIA